VAGDARALKVHVHNERPDQVIGYGLSIGALSRISVENLDHQAREVRETRAATFTGTAIEIEPARPGEAEGAATAEAANGSGAANAPAGGSPGPAASLAVAARPALGVLAVVAGDGLAAIFREFGVAEVVEGGQSANTSTGELLEGIEALDAAEIIVLPNNPNVILAARQAASMTARPIVVVPTRNAAEGFAALLALEPQLGAAANLGPMSEAARAIQSLAVTEAVRDAAIGGRKVKRGQTIVLDPDDGLVAVDGDRTRSVLAAVGRLRPGFELLTIFYGDGADLAETEGMARRIGAVLPGVEVEVRHGGQPFYRYLIAAE
jgi:dihydroxyacetone kinase-like predicted kinase